jgi:hypothetical protein
MKQFITSILFILATGSLFSQAVQFNFSNSGGQVAPNGTVDVDVRVSDFTNVAGMQIAVHWDETVLNVSSIENINTSLSGLATSNFAFGNTNSFGSLRMSWSAISEATLPDDAILFTMRMNAIGNECDYTGFSIFGSDSFPIEIFDFNLNFKDFCTNTYVSQISGSNCTPSNVLSCNDNINVSIGNTKVVLVTPDIVLEGGPYDYTRINVVPAKLTCANDGQTVNYTATDAVTGNSCFGTITVEDRLGVCDGSGSGNGPLACTATVNVSLNSDGEAQLFPQSVLVGTYDYSTITVSPSLLDCSNVGTSQYLVNDSNTNNSCFGNLIVSDNLSVCDSCEDPDTTKPTPFCIASSTVVISGGAVDVFAIDFNIGSFDNCTEEDDLRFTFTDTDPASDPDYLTASNSSRIVLTDADLNGMSSRTLSLDMYVWDENSNRDFCRVGLTITNDNTTSSNVTLSMPDVIGEQGNQICVPIRTTGFNEVSALQGTIEWDSQVASYNSTQAHALPGFNNNSFFNITVNQLTFVWFDNTGNTPSTLSNGAAVFEVCFDVIGATGQSTRLDFVDSPTQLLSSDNNGNEFAVQGISGSITVGTAPDCANDVTPPVAVCSNSIIASTDNGSVTLFASDFDNGSYDNCTSDSNLLITFDGGATSREFTLADVDTNNQVDVTIFVTDESGNVNACFTTLTLLNDGCDIDEDDISFPTVLLNVDVVINDISEVSAAFEPDALLSRPEYNESDVFPTFSQIGCSNIATAYEDNVFVINDNLGWYKVIRTWTVIDWLTTDVYTGNQVIQNYGQADEYICDTLPRSAPVGDCDSGHTLTDDVEWPDDISISDHRIKPDELIMSSMIDSLDARPNFYDDQQFYTASYVDVVNTLTQETLIIDRQWTVSRTDIVGLSFDYTQMITIDLTTFSRLVTVNTYSNRPVPDVDVDGLNVTNAQGLVYTDANVEPIKSDSPDNGLNILDLILMQAHELGQRTFNEFELAAGDINSDQEISNSDISSVRRVILGLDDQLSASWNFIDRTGFSETGVEPKAHYIAIKPGDVDDSAVLSSDVVVDATESIYITDTILNAGELYSIPLFFGRDIQSHGAELHLDFDNTVLDIRSVSATDAFGEISWSLDGDSRIVILNYNGDGESEMITTDTPILTLDFEALQNGTLQTANFAVADDRDSWIVDENYNLLRIEETFVGQIGTNTEDIQNLGINVYPNPAADIVTFDVDNVVVNEEYNIQLSDITGRIIFNQNNVSVLDLSNVESGIYLYKLTVAGRAQTGKLIIKK